MSIRLAWISGIAAMFAFASCNASIVAGSVGSIVHFYSYSTFGNGDVAVVAQYSLPGCADGFWLRSSDPGFKNVFAQLMSA